MPAPRDLAFISYSHADQVWLTRFQILLKPYVRKGHFTLWADPHIQVGERWEREIAGALARARVGILLLSQSFAASDFIFEVELPALLAAAQERQLTLFCVPVSAVDPHVLDLNGYQWARPPGQPLDLLDEPTRNQALVQVALKLVEIFGTDTRELEAQSQSLALARPVAPLAHGGERLAQLRGVPSLPENFIPRDSELVPFKRSLFEQANARHGIAAPRRGLHGQGGIGKTVLATALAHDTEVRQAFPDGIYWVTLGQEPNLLALQQSLLALAGVQRAVESINVGAAALRDALAGKRCLLVLDDVWQAPHLAAFDALGPEGRLLVTTRDREILSQLGASTFDLGVLSPDAARVLLASWVGVPPETLPLEASEVAEECGYLPLALAVAGAQVADGMAWIDGLDALRAGDVEFLDHAHQSVFKSLSASVRALSDTERERYLDLAIFPEDTAVPASVVVRLWEQAGLKSYQAKQLLRRFANKALLALSEDVVTFHDLQGDYLRLVAENSMAIHERLLATYRDRLPPAERESRRWAELPASEGYLWTHLFHHVQGADRRALLDELVTDALWLRAKAEASGVSALLTDLAHLVGRAPSADSRRIERALWQETGWLHQNHGALPALLHNRLRGEAVDALEVERLLGGVRPRTRVVHPVRFGEGRVFRGHSARVTSCAYSPDGSRILSGSFDWTLRQWDSATGKELSRFEGHSGAVYACAYSPDGSRILSASNDKTLREWDSSSGIELTRFEGHSDAVTACAYSPDGSRILSASDDKTLREWDRSSGIELTRFEGHSGEVTACAYSPHGTRVLSASVDNTLREWHSVRGIELARFDGYSGEVIACAYSPDGTRVLSAFANTLLELNATTGIELSCFEGGVDLIVTACAYSPDGCRILSAFDDNSLREWDCATGSEFARFEGHVHRVTACAYSPDGTRILSASADGTLREWLPTGKRQPARFEGHAQRVTACVYSPDGTRILSASVDNTLREWHRASGRVLTRFEGHFAPVTACAYAPDGAHVLSVSEDHTFREWDCATGQEIARFEGHTGEVTACSYSPDGAQLISASLDNTLRVWDRSTRREVARFEGHSDGVIICAYSPDGSRILSASWDHTLREWDRATGHEITRIDANIRWVTACTYSPDGSRILSAFGDNTLREWDRATGRQLARIEGHSSPVFACAYSPDGTRFLSASQDSTVRLWQRPTAHCLDTLYGAAPMRCLAVTRGQFVTGDDLGNLWIVDCDWLE